MVHGEQLGDEAIQALHDTYSSLNRRHEAANDHLYDDNKQLKLKVEILNHRENNSRLTYDPTLRMKINESQMRSHSNPRF